MAATSFNEQRRDITSGGWFTDRLAADPEQQRSELKLKFWSVFEGWENINNNYHFFLFLFTRKEWKEHKTSIVFLKMEMKAAIVLIVSTQDIMRCYKLEVIEVNNVYQVYQAYQVIYLNSGMRMRNRLKLQALYIQEIRRRFNKFQSLLNQIRKLKNFSTFNFEHRRSCSTKVHNSNVLFHRFVAANYLVVSKTMEQEPCHQARG